MHYFSLIFPCILRHFNISSISKAFNKIRGHKPITEDQKFPLLKLCKKCKPLGFNTRCENINGLRKGPSCLDYYLEEKNDFKFKMYVRVKKMTRETLSFIKLKPLIKLGNSEHRGNKAGWLTVYKPYRKPFWKWVFYSHLSVQTSQGSLLLSATLSTLNFMTHCSVIGRKSLPPNKRKMDILSGRVIIKYVFRGI